VQVGRLSGFDGKWLERVSPLSGVAGDYAEAASHRDEFDMQHRFFFAGCNI
jgi:hypothetical protein